MTHQQQGAALLPLDGAETFTYASANGRDRVAAAVWQPAGPVRGVVQLCHGMAEHMGRYVWLAKQLTARGFLVVGNDHVGHGRTAETADDWGYFGKRNGWRVWIDDVHALRRRFQAQAPGLPYFLLGHSMGSFISRAYVARYGEGLAGYVCCGTSGRNPGAAAGLVLAQVQIALGRGRKPGKLLDTLAFGRYNARCGKGAPAHAWLSSDEDTWAPFVDDPACGFVFSNAGFRDLFCVLNSVSSPAWSDAVPKTLPILLLAGEEDPVGQYGRGVRQVYGWLKASGVTDVTIKLYPGARHELQNERCREEFVGDVVAWLEAHGSTTV